MKSGISIDGGSFEWINLEGWIWHDHLWRGLATMCPRGHEIAQLGAT